MGDGKPTYSIKQAESNDGIVWSNIQRVEVGPSGCRCVGWPMVWKDGVFKMIYSHRNLNSGYKLGLAFSQDGITWNDSIIDGLNPSNNKEDWDSEMICYTAKYCNYIFYNGNGYGETGIGLAEIL